MAKINMRLILIFVLLVVGCAKQPEINMKNGDDILNDIKKQERAGKGVC
jgi:hypothetical protein